MNNFLPLLKADRATRTVWARAAAEEPDKAREIMDYVSARPAFETWSNGFATATMGKSLGNIRAMHNPKHLAGKVQEIVFDDEAKHVNVCIKVLDPVDWAKVEEGGYTGLSIGGGYARKWPDPLHKDHTRYTPRISEISLVDTPCIPSARFLELHKQDGSIEEVLLKGVAHTFNDLRPPPTFDQLLQKSVFTATRDVIGRINSHPATDAVKGAIKVGKTLKDAATLATLGTTALTGGYAVSHRHHHDDELKHPRYMRKSLASGLGELGARAGKFAASYAEAGRSIIGRTRAGGALGRTAGKVAAHPRVAAAAKEIGHTGWKGAIAPVHTLARAGGAAIGGARAANIAGKVGLAADYAPVAYTAGKVTGLIPDKKPDPAEKMAKAAAEKAKIAQTMHEWKAGKLRSYRGVNPRSGKPRRGPKVTDQRQAIAIALSQARRAKLGKGLLSTGIEALGTGARVAGKAVGRALANPRAAGAAVGRTLASPGVRHVAKEAAWDAGGAALTGGALYGAAKGAQAVGNAFSSSKPKPADDLAKPSYMKKGLLGAGASGAVTGLLAGTAIGALRGRKPAKEHSALGHLGYAAITGGTPYIGYRIGRRLIGKEPTLDKPGYMKKAEEIGAIINQRILESGTAKPKGELALPNYMGKAAIIAAGLAKRMGGGALSESEHAERIAAVKARWLKEGHHDLDDHFDAAHAAASTSWLGAKHKVAAVAKDRKETWEGVARSQEAYDKLRPHMPDHAMLMIHVPHRSRALLNNPEGIGPTHFANLVQHTVYGLHPDEADDWIKHFGKGAGVSKAAPSGLIEDPHVFDGATVDPHGAFVRLPEPTEEAQAA